MKCKQVSEMLREGDPPAGGLRVRAHLAVCRRCRAEARSLRVVRQAVQEFGRYEPPTDLLPAILAVPNATAPLQVPVKEERGMRRIVFASIAIVAVLIGGAIVIPGRWKKPDAHSILVGVAHAMEQAKSLHIVFRGTETTNDTPTGLRIMSGRQEVWFSSRAMYAQFVGPDGEVTYAGGADLDAGQWWHYTREDRTRWLGDLRPVAATAAEVVSAVPRILVSERMTELFGKKLRDAKETVTVETRDGRKVSIVTLTGTPTNAPRPGLTTRLVVEVDPETNHILTFRQYGKARGGEEQLVQAMDRVEYDAPFPSHAFSIPEGTKTVKVPVLVEETKDTVSLVMKHEGHTVRFEVPREK